MPAPQSQPGGFDQLEYRLNSPQVEPPTPTPAQDGLSSESDDSVQPGDAVIQEGGGGSTSPQLPATPRTPESDESGIPRTFQSDRQLEDDAPESFGAETPYLEKQEQTGSTPPVPAPQPIGPQFQPPEVSRPARLSLSVGAPKQRSAGSGVTYHVSIENLDDWAAEDVVVECSFDESLIFPGRPEKKVRQEIGQLAAGEKRSIALTLNSSQPGEACCRFVLLAGGREIDAQTVCVDILREELDVTIVGPEKRTRGSRAEYVVTIVNTSSRSLSDVKAVITYDAALVPKEASTGARQQPGRLTWDLMNVVSQESIQIEVEFECHSVSQAAAIAVEVSGKGVGRRRAEKSLTIEPQREALQLQVHDRHDPVSVGGRTEYVLMVQNHAAGRSRPIQLVARVPPNTRILGVGAQTTSRRDRPRSRVDGSRVVVEAPRGLSGRAVLTCRIAVAAVRAGHGEVLASLRYPRRPPSIEVQETTTVNP